MDWLFCLGIKIMNFFLAVGFTWWIESLIFILEFLPPSPIQFEPVQWGSFGNAVGYFIPVQTMMNHFAAALIAITLWYGLQHILRILKMIR